MKKTIIFMMLLLIPFAIGDEAWEFHTDNGSIRLNTSNMLDTKYCKFFNNRGLVCNDAGTGAGAQWTIDYYSLENATDVLQINETYLNATIDARDSYSPKWDIGNSLYNNSAKLDVSLDWFNETYQNLSAIRYYNASSLNLIDGTTADSIADLQSYNGSAYNVTEAVGVPGLTFHINFTGVLTFNELIFRVKTYGNTQSTLVYLWDYGSSSWEEYFSYAEVDAFQTFSLGVFDSSEHIQAGVVRMRIYQAAAGNTAHHHAFDWITLASSPATFSTTEIDPLSIHISHLYYKDFLYDGMLRINSSTYWNKSSDINTSYDINIGGGYGAGGISLYAAGSLWIGSDIMIAGDILSVDATSINGTFLPDTDDTYDLGNSSLQWRNGYFDGTLEADVITLNGNDIDTRFYSSGEEANFGNITLSNSFGAGATLETLIKFGNATISANSTHLCIVGTGYLCVEH